MRIPHRKETDHGMVSRLTRTACIPPRRQHRVTRGFPLDALSVEIRSGRHYHDLEDEAKRDAGTVDASASPASTGKYALSEETGGFHALFQRVMPLLRQYCPADEPLMTTAGPGD